MATGLAVLVAGCGPGDAGPRPAMTSLAPPPAARAAEPTAVAVPDAQAVRDTGAPFGAGPQGAGALLLVDGATVQEQDAGDGSTHRTVAAAPGVVAWVAPPHAGRVEVQPDGSATLHDEAGTVVTALGAPVGADGDPAVWRPHGDVLALDVATGPVSFVVGTDALLSAVWGDADGGPSLLVSPQPWVRRGSTAAQHALVSQVQVAAPEAAAASMQAQLWCHLLGAPDKDSWNIEPWRPEVGTLTMLATGCNPTDADA
ncbi:Protein of unknown function DUF2599 [Cellulomonas flavigena DSM 20109]|uniref:DUF2599 domain-containing protein n=1 Tax=Cellulomonas flavigena (strain ATCC 482 / DSM 20109 / BCRC 11376 / JCM 18109 / NBRC 3775 / NCIMB 8073 / NRS 134) TaxID=446466 RepID=D5UKE5_CELFN|nr:Protein of unknown function DUF2599 [Cellulomonas flavigena DSM 20109]